MKKNIFYILVIYYSIIGQIFAQEYPRIKSAKINCSTIFSTSNKLFYYKYIITNDQISTGDLISFGIDISLIDSTEVDTVGLIFNNALERTFFDLDYPDLKGKVILPGISNTPSGWDGSLTQQYTLDFFGFPEIKPGEFLNNFEINSFGLPSIRKVIFSIAKDTVIDSWPSIEDTTSTLSFGQMDSILASLDYSSWTVAPNFFPKDISFSAIIDTITSYTQRSSQLGWIKNQSTADKYANYFNTAKTQLQQNNITGVRSTLNNVLSNASQDSTSNLTSEAYALIRYNTEYLLANLPAPTNPGLAVKMISSNNNILTTGYLQYYEGSWKDAVNNNDGTFFVNTTLKTVSLRMTYEGGTQTLSNVVVGSDTVVFRTVNTSVLLKNSSGNLVDQGTVQYYAGAWRDFGSTTNGVTNKELLPNTYSFRMTYAFASNDKQQNIGTDPNVIFQTVNAAVQLKNSSGNLVDQGTVQYYAGAWRDFGTTTNGVANKELLPNNYSFRMNYAYASNDKQQNVGIDPNVIFQTVNAAVQLKNSSGNLIDQGTVQYYTGAWRDFGTTINGVTNKELLPNNYSFRMTYEYVSKDIAQNIGTSNIVNFSTVLCTISVKDSQGQPVNNADAKYYSGAWREIGLTSNGIVTKELLPANLSFRINYGTTQQDKTQDLSTGSIVQFSLP